MLLTSQEKHFLIALLESAEVGVARSDSKMRDHPHANRHSAV
jgi:hypothetical protein